MGAASTKEEDEEDDSRYVPPPHDWHHASIGIVHLKMIVKIQAAFRGRRARRTVLMMGVSAASKLFHGFGSTGERAILGAKTRALCALIHKIDLTMHDTYSDVLKARLTPCPAMPQALRELIHSLGDYAWSSAHASMLSSVEEAVIGRFAPKVYVTEEAVQEAAECDHSYLHAGQACSGCCWKLRHARAALLYAYCPYDKTFWMKLRSPDSLLLLLLMALPFWILRASIYSVLLLCKAVPWHEASEYQMMSFILVLKGSQFFSGILMGLGTMLLTWRCAVLDEPSTCEARYSRLTLSVFEQLCAVAYTQLLVGLALYLGYHKGATWSCSRLIATLSAALRSLRSLRPPHEVTSASPDSAADVDGEEEAEDVEAAGGYAAAHALPQQPQESQQPQQVQQKQPQNSHDTFLHLLLWDAASFVSFIVALLGCTMRTGWGWRGQMSYDVLLVLFMLSAFPFVPYYLGSAMGMTAMAQTGYNRSGRCVPIDTRGLSAYCHWVLNCLKRTDVQQALPEATARRLRRSCDRLIGYTEAHPHAKHAHLVRREEMQRDLQQAIRGAVVSCGRDRGARLAADPLQSDLYCACFPIETMIAEHHMAVDEAASARRRQRTRELSERILLGAHR